MPKDTLTDIEVEMEIERLKDSEYVKLVEKEIRLKARQRKYLYQLRWMEKRGKQLHGEGITLDNIEERLFANLPDGDEI